MAVKGTGAVVAIGKESTWGTAVADTMLLNFSSESIKLNGKKVEEDNLLASKAASGYDLMTLNVSGDISGILKPENAGFLMKAALGGPDTVTVVSATQQHSIIAAAANGVIPSYTLFVNRKVATKKYSGCKIDSLKISAKAGDFVKFTASFKGKDEAAGSIVTTTPPSLKAYKLINGTLTLGATALDFTGCDLGINNNLDDGVQTNTSGVYATEPVHSTRKITLDIDMPYDANSEAIRETNFKTQALLATAVLHLESPSIITAALVYRMDVTLANVAVLDAVPNVSGKDVISITLKCEATVVGAAEPITAVIYDAQAAAY